MINTTLIKTQIYTAISGLIEDKTTLLDETTQLIGDGSVLDSMKLVELCLLLEDIAGEIGFEFDWTSDSAMSRSRSMFRTTGTLVAEFIAQAEQQK
jgi:acyl carrier protein